MKLFWEWMCQMDRCTQSAAGKVSFRGSALTDVSDVEAASKMTPNESIRLV